MLGWRGCSLALVEVVKSDKLRGVIVMPVQTGAAIARFGELLGKMLFLVPIL